MKEIIKSDENGRIIYEKLPNGYEEWYEYNDNGNLVHYKDSEGFEKWYKYDNKGNIIRTKDSNGCETWRDDENCNIVHSKNSEGFEELDEYDNNGNMIHSKDSNEEYTNNHKSDMIKNYLEEPPIIKNNYKRNDETIEVTSSYIRKYDKAGNLVFFKSGPMEFQFMYDENNILINYTTKIGSSDIISNDWNESILKESYDTTRDLNEAKISRFRIPNKIRRYKHKRFDHMARFFISDTYKLYKR